MNAPSPTIHPAPAFRPVGLVGAIILPGLGHVLVGERPRGLCIGAGILALFFGGIFIGGIDVIDSREDPVWFYGQALVGPLAVGVDQLHQHHFKVIDPVSGVLRSAYPSEGRDPATRDATPNGTPPNRKSIGKMNEIGTLFATIAGFINLIAIIDAAVPGPRARPASANA
ncbi:MAG: DUF6677 family protein [Planctomycetota bacterium]|nr:DUF6677 family protein [Planctomycetota bacterium]